jgi:type I restriction enzyme M protein
MFEQAFKTIDQVLRNDAGVSSELDYTEQTSWILFLRYLDELGDIQTIRDTFIDFQKYLYEASVAI